MANTENSIEFNFSYYALKLLGKNLYSNSWSAISELVANGLDAQASSVKLFINMSDKEHSTIEILDNGSGMSYDDLANKYVFMGKNKRDNLSEKLKNSVMGRKGIGKLAALFLSKKYFIITKTTENDETSWYLDSKNADDSSIPTLERCNVKDANIETLDIWNTYKSGTLIKLTDVDLTGIGYYKLEGLKARLANFFLTDSLRSSIEVCVLNNKTDIIHFEPVKKEIAFKNMYLLFSDNESNANKQIGDTVVVGKTQYPEVAEKPRNVKILTESEFPNIKGKRILTLKDGITQANIKYEMKGWIGLHTSIENKYANLNDDRYLKNEVFNPNQLRLYVRKKLAVENFLDILKNTQAFSNYIEGEISFDILDDDRFEDIATTNRQSIVTDDERVKLLIEILNPIVGKMIRERVKLGQEVKEEEEAIESEIIRQREEQERLQEEAIIAAEKQAEKEKKAKEEAELEKAKEKDRRKKAEEDAKKAKEAQEVAEANLESETRRANFLENQNEPDKVLDALITHIIKQLAGGIENDVNSIIAMYYENTDSVSKEDLIDVLEAASFDMALMKQAAKVSLIANFNLKENKVRTDLYGFIEDYINQVALKNLNRNLKIRFINNDKLIHNIVFSPFEICLFMVNIIDNTIKYKSSERPCELEVICKKNKIIFKNNGIPLKAGIEKHRFFKQGFTTCEDISSGLGLYHCMNIAKNIKANLDIENNEDYGIKLILELSNED